MDNIKFCYQLSITITKFVNRLFSIKMQEIPRVFFASSEKMPFKYACAMAHTVLLPRPISAEIRTVDSQSDLIIFL